jgi:hypothetical protein
VRFHTVTIPLDDAPDSEPLKQILGEPIEVTIGFGAESVYVAAGPDGIGTIKQVMEQSSASTSTEELPPMHMSVSLGQILNLVAKQGAGNPVVGMGAMMLQGGQDHVHFILQPIENGLQYRLELEEGLLKLVGMAANIAMNAGGAGNF